MNILPKKRWHVRTKQNIERVRKDEANALEEEQKTKKKIQLAEQEARVSFLRSKNLTQKSSSSVNYIEEANYINKGFNAEHEEEKKAEKEKFERNIGLLNYLGQSSVGEKPWYLMPHEKRVSDEVTKNKGGRQKSKEKVKSLIDPLNNMKKYLNLKKQHKNKLTGKITKPKSSKKTYPECKNKSGISSKKEQRLSSIHELRAKRIAREKEERRKAELLLKNCSTVTK